jgi:hypothetical protein
VSSCNRICLSATVSPPEGESGPKIMPKGVVDGQQVNIPILSLVGTEESRLAERWL